MNCIASAQLLGIVKDKQVLFFHINNNAHRLIFKPGEISIGQKQFLASTGNSQKL